MIALSINSEVVLMSYNGRIQSFCWDFLFDKGKKGICITGDKGLVDRVH